MGIHTKVKRTRNTRKTFSRLKFFFFGEFNTHARLAFFSQADTVFLIKCRSVCKNFAFEGVDDRL